MELAWLPTNMGGLGVGKLTRDSAAVAVGTCPAVPALAREAEEERQKVATQHSSSKRGAGGNMPNQEA